MDKLSQTGILEELDYSPFGMTLVGRSWSGGSEYRYAYNGKEQVKEITGNSNSIDFGARIYDARICRFMSTDPLEMEYPFQSSYVFAANSPILLIDFNGLGPKTPSSTKDEAQKVLDDFKKSNPGSSKYFPNVDPEKLIANLQTIITDPSFINQGEGTDFCGKASLLQFVANKDPKGYVQLVIDLYNDGSANYNNGSKNISFKPSDDVRSAAGTLTETGLANNHADQIMLLSLSTKYKSGAFSADRNYQSGDEKNPFWAGTTLSTYLEMFRDFGYSAKLTGSNTSASWANGKQKGQKINNAITNGATVFLFVNGPMLRNESPTMIKQLTGTHFIPIRNFTYDSFEKTFSYDYWDYGSWKSTNTSNVERHYFSSYTF